MGGGKTLFSSLKAKEFSKINQNSKIYSNYKLNLPNAVYTPYLFLDYSSLNCDMIICDDIYSMQNLNGFIALIVNMSRKLELEIILTCQYRTMIPPMIRMLSVLTEVQYSKENDILFVIYQKGENLELEWAYNAVKEAKNLYDTKEVVNISTQSKIEKEIMKWSKSIEDLEINISLFAKNRLTQDKMFKKLRKHFE